MGRGPLSIALKGCKTQETLIQTCLKRRQRHDRSPQLIQPALLSWICLREQCG